MNSKIYKSSSSVLYISHGGGPLPLLGDGYHKELVANLKYITTIIERPSAIIVISAHWEELRPTITGGKNPQLIYDYYGFPKSSYEIEYPAPGNPKLANKIYEKLMNKGIEANLDANRGFDHGLFVPLKIMYPAADIPCIQVSLVRGLNPAEHIQIGNALSSMLDENVLILGSGFSFHNLRALLSQPTKDSQRMNESFEHWLVQTCSTHNLGEKEREYRLVNWEDAPAARYCHPREEHLLPLHVCFGAVNRAAKQVFRFEVMRRKASAYLW